MRTSWVLGLSTLVLAVSGSVAAALPTPRAAAPGVARVPVPAAGRAVDTSHPNHVVGHGGPAGCTSRAVVRAVAEGGVITFDCGPDPIVIGMRRVAKVVNTSHRVVIDGGGLVTLRAVGTHRLIYQDTCDQRQVGTTSHCQDQATPRLVVQHLTLAGGDSTGQTFEGGGGGAIFDRGGQLKIVDSRFVGNRCDPTGPDLGGAGVRALSQYDGRPVWVVGSVFRGGRCSNGAGVSSIGVSWNILNSRFFGNRAIGHGANPQRPNTPGGGSGGAVYADGDGYRIRIAGTLMRHNHANEGGGAVFFVSNDRTGDLAIDRSTLEDNLSAGFETIPGIFYLGTTPRPAVTESIVR